MCVVFPPLVGFEACAWKRVNTFAARTPETLYLNPKLLEAYESMRTGSDKARILVLIHCVVCHELAHLLHHKIYDEIDPYFGDASSNVDYGTELEHQIFGGRMLSMPDFSKLRIERKTDPYST